MTDSFKKIDYRLRPSKHVERLMLSDLMSRLGRIYPLKDYRYVGMGSVYFVDFELFHRRLGIARMASIEAPQPPDVQQRFQDNIPFSNIQMLWGKTQDVLPTIDLEDPTALWLDYDGHLTSKVLDDLTGIAIRAPHGTMLSISVNCGPDDGRLDKNYVFNKDSKHPLLEYAKFAFGPNRIATRWKNSHLINWGTANLFYALMTNELQQALTQRNQVGSNAKIQAFQLAHFRYKDGAPMLTLTWLFMQEGYDFSMMDFDEFEFYRTASKPFHIDFPLLTVRELRYLERQFPSLPGNLTLGSVPGPEAKKFLAIYRYFTNFAPTPLM